MSLLRVECGSHRTVEPHYQAPPGHRTGAGAVIFISWRDGGTGTESSAQGISMVNLL